MKKLVAFLILSLGTLGARPARAQIYADVYLTSINFNIQYPCGNPGISPTTQIQTSLTQLGFYAGGTLDLTCYQGPISITSDIFSPVTSNILIYLPEHAITVNANATIPSNIELCGGPGASIAAGATFTLTNNASKCFNGWTAAGGGTPTGPAGGDLAGTYPNPTVHGVNGTPVPASEPCVGTNGSAVIIAGVCMTWPSGSAGVPNYNGSQGWGTTYNASNPIPFNFLATTVANTSLSNLASVAVNTSLLAGITNSIDLGSSSFIWRNLYVNALQGTPNVPNGATLTIQSGGTLTCAAGSTCPAGVIPVQTSSTPSVLYSGSYTSGITATGTVNQTCSLSTFNNGGSGATATVALSGTNTVSAGTPLVVTAIGSGFTSAPTSATAGNGSATCSGTATVATTIAAPVADPGGISYAQYCGTTGCIFTTPAGASGYQRIYRNATTDFGVITVQLPASNTADLGGVNTNSAGCLQSSGALGDAIYIFSDTTNHWYAYPQGGSWFIQSGNTCN